MKNANHLKTKLPFTLYIFLLSSIGASYLFGEAPLDLHSIFSSFYSEECIDITLESDFNKLIKNKKTVTYQNAWITYTTNKGEEIKQLIQIRPRGRSRRRICDIPPVKLNFARGNADAINIKEDRALKLVTHCFEQNTIKGQQNVLKEYLAYKLLNIITEKSFRVQLVRINYLDIVDHTSSQRFGFIIEGTNELANRLEATRVKKYATPIAHLETDQHNTVALFQYMISNADWKINILHNVKTFESKASGKIVVIPYDFDYSGLVNTGYAKGNPNYDQDHVKQRIFLGGFDDEEALSKTLNLFQSKKEEILSYCESLNYLSDKNREKVEKFIKSFYKRIESKKFVKREFIKRLP